MKRIAFDLIEGNAIVGFQVRPGCLELLERVRPYFTLYLWSAAVGGASGRGRGRTSATSGGASRPMTD